MDDGEDHHLFFLRASRALIDPERRHKRASVGHARSRDWKSWELLPDAMVGSDSPAWDDMAIWTGSVVKGHDSVWHLFYTGVSRAERGLVQRIGLAVSEDLMVWNRVGDGPLLEADPQWYEKLDLDAWIDEAWRDPWVFADPDGDGWHMLITARSPHGPATGRSVIGHARSADLRTWEVQPPLSEPSGFGQLEVPQSLMIDGRPHLVFSCWPERMDDRRRALDLVGGVHVVPGKTLLGPWDLDAAVPLDHPSLYAAHLVQEDSGQWSALGFRDREDGVFVGEIADPVPLVVGTDGAIRVAPRRPPAKGWAMESASRPSPP